MAETLVLVEFDRGRPFHVVTTETGDYFYFHDFQYSKRDDLIYHHMSGGSPEVYAEWPDHHRIWVADGVVFSVKRKLRRLPARWADPFAEAVHGCVEWCDECVDYISAESLCEHIWWCDECGMHSTPNDRCRHTAALQEVQA